VIVPDVINNKLLLFRLIFPLITKLALVAFILAPITLLKPSTSMPLLIVIALDARDHTLSLVIVIKPPPPPPIIVELPK
jgi:hypothetical protein